VRLVIGQVFPEWDTRALNVSRQVVMAVINGLTDADGEAMTDGVTGLW
jgi:hypothetical protein